MATKTKLEKQRQELIEKYGDKVLMEIVDYYYPEITFVKTGVTQRNICATVRLSQIAIESTGDLRNIERVLMEKRIVVRMMKFKQSKDLFFSQEEIERRNKYIEEHRTIYTKNEDVRLPMLIKDTVDAPGDSSQSDTHQAE